MFGMVLRKKADTDLDMRHLSAFLNLPQTNSVLQTVIELPGGIIPGTGVKSVLLVIAKQFTDQGVLIVDLDRKEIADKSYVSKGRGRC